MGCPPGACRLTVTLNDILLTHGAFETQDPIGFQQAHRCDDLLLRRFHVFDLDGTEGVHSRNAQVGSNLQNVKTEVDTAEQAVQAAELILERVRVLAAQGATGTQTPATRLAIAEEVRALQEQLVSLSATQVGARYVFGGDADQTAPYTLDTVTPDVGGGVVQANAAQATRQIRDPLGNTFGVDRTAQQIFDDQNPPGTPTANNVLRP